MRKKIAAGNWKMNTTPEEGKQLVKNIIAGSPELKNHQEVYFFPPFTHISSAVEVSTKQNFHTGAQNCSARIFYDDIDLVSTSRSICVCSTPWS